MSVGDRKFVWLWMVGATALSVATFLSVLASGSDAARAQVLRIATNEFPASRGDPFTSLTHNVFISYSEMELTR